MSFLLGYYIISIVALASANCEPVCYDNIQVNWDTASTFDVSQNSGFVITGTDSPDRGVCVISRNVAESSGNGAVELQLTQKDHSSNSSNPGICMAANGISPVTLSDNTVVTTSTLTAADDMEYFGQWVRAEGNTTVTVFCGDLCGQTSDSAATPLALNTVATVLGNSDHLWSLQNATSKQSEQFGMYTLSVRQQPATTSPITLTIGHYSDDSGTCTATLPVIEVPGIPDTLMSLPAQIFADGNTFAQSFMARSGKYELNFTSVCAHGHAEQTLSSNRQPIILDLSQTSFLRIAKFFQDGVSFLKISTKSVPAVDIQLKFSVWNGSTLQCSDYDIRQYENILANQNTSRLMLLLGNQISGDALMVHVGSLAHIGNVNLEFEVFDACENPSVIIDDIDTSLEFTLAPTATKKWDHYVICSTVSTEFHLEVDVKSPNRSPYHIMGLFTSGQCVPQMEILSARGDQDELFYGSGVVNAGECLPMVMLWNDNKDPSGENAKFTIKFSKGGALPTSVSVLSYLSIIATLLHLL